MREIVFTKEFTDTPGGRFRKHGDWSGEQFRQDFLEPALRDNDFVVLDLNGAFGFPSSFIDEAFGVLVERVGIATIRQKLRVKLTDDPVTLRKIEKAFSEHRRQPA
jgi:hypothetical protein